MSSKPPQPVSYTDFCAILGDIVLQATLREQRLQAAIQQLQAEMETLRQEGLKKKTNT